MYLYISIFHRYVAYFREYPHAKPPGDQQRPSDAQARHHSQPSAISATPATRNEGGCHQAPRLPRKVTVDFAKSHTCHATSTAPPPPQPAQRHKCHACRAKRRWMPPRATPATQSDRGCCQSEPLPKLGNQNGKALLYHWNLYRNPRNHDGKGLFTAGTLTGTQDIMMAKGLFSAGTCGPEPANHSQS